MTQRDAKQTGSSSSSDEEGHGPVRSSYDRLAGVYDRRWRRYVEATNAAAREAVELKGDERVLDVACGTGALLAALASRGVRPAPVGVDLSLPMLRGASVRVPQARLIQGEASHLPLVDRAFDLVYCVNSFHYFRRPEAALGEAWRVLRPGGRLVLIDWCDDYLTCKLCSAYLRWADPAFHQIYGLGECRAMLERAGLTVTTADRFRIGWIWGMMRFVARRGEERIGARPTTDA